MNNRTGENVKTYQYVFDYFSDQILSGTLKLGDRIPPERDIADELGVSRNSIREVMHMLEINGLIECVQGSGNYVRCDPQDYMVKSSRMIVSLLDISSRDIIDLRRGFEMIALELATESADEDELAAIHDILDHMDRAESSKASAELDQAFHISLVNASHNQLLIMYYGMSVDLINAFIKDSHIRILADKKRARQLMKSHWSIYEALVSKDMDAGLQAMNRHYSIVRDYIEKQI